VEANQEIMHEICHFYLSLGEEHQIQEAEALGKGPG
jgi:hypothetical protein